MEKLDKCRVCRRVGEKLFLKGDKCSLPSCPVAKRPYAPGQTGAKGSRRKASDYSKQLLEKQKARAIYGISEKQMANYFKEARKMRHSTGTELINILESRADNMVYRAGFARSRSEARQMVVHGNIVLNNRKIKSPSLKLKVGDSVKVNLKNLPEVNKEVASWITTKKGSNEFTVNDVAVIDNATQAFNIQLIIEFYSR